EWLDFFHLAGQVCVGDTHWSDLFNPPNLRWSIDTRMQRDLSTISKREFAFGRLTEQVIDEPFAVLRMWSALDQDDCVRQNQDAETTRLLIRVDDLDWLALFLPVHRVVAINEREVHLSGRDEVRAFAVARGCLHAVFFHLVHEGPSTFVAPHREQS